MPYIEQQNIYNLFAGAMNPTSLTGGLMDARQADAPSAGNGKIVDHGPDYGLDSKWDLFPRSQAIKVFFCPSDTGPIVNESGSTEWARSRGNYRGCTGAGNYFGGSDPQLDPSAG